MIRIVLAISIILIVSIVLTIPIILLGSVILLVPIILVVLSVSIIMIVTIVLIISIILIPWIVSYILVQLVTTCLTSEQLIKAAEILRIDHIVVSKLRKFQAIGFIIYQPNDLACLVGCKIIAAAVECISCGRQFR